MVDDYTTKLKDAKTKLEIAQDISQVSVITDGSQFSSPFSQNDLGGADGGNITDGVLIDGKTDTYWQSVWSGTPTCEDVHYFQVELTEPLTQQVYIKFTRRNINNNQITDWVICGAEENDESLLQEDCEELFTWNTPWNSGNQTESFKSGLFDTKGYKYIRFYNGGTNSGSSFFHLSEIQLCYDVDNPKAQYKMMGALATNLEKVIADQKDIILEGDEENLTEAEYDTFIAAYNAFIAKFVDPNPLRDKLAEVDGASAVIKVGTNPGFWASDAVGQTFDKTFADAKAYDAAGKYDAETSETFITNLTEQAEAIMPAANPIETGKWYRFRFGTEEEFEANGWSTAGNTIENRVIDEEIIGMYNEALFGKYITIADYEEEQIDIDNGNPVYGHRVVPITKDKVALDNALFADDDADILDKDLSTFRFVPFENGYAIQNKATGLFLQSKPEDNWAIRLSVHPSLFAQHVVGWGANAFFIKNIDGTAQAPFHLARNYNVLTRWGNESGSGWNDNDGRRGCFFVEEVGDATDYVAPTEARISMWPGAVSARCYPVELQAKSKEEGVMWSIASIEREEGDEENAPVVKLNLTPVKDQTAFAGRPFLYIKGGDWVDADERDEEDEPAVSVFTFNTNDFQFVTKPNTEGFLKGCFAQTTPPAGSIIPSDNSYTITKKDDGNNVGTNRAYISEAEAFDKKAEVEIACDEEGEDGIATVLQRVAKNGEIYTIDGRLVSKSGNLNTLRSLGKGIYILNGTKVTVK